MQNKLMIAALLTAALPLAHADDKLAAKVDKLVAESFKPGEGQDMSCLTQDETQKVCSTTATTPPRPRRRSSTRANRPRSSTRKATN